MISVIIMGVQILSNVHIVANFEDINLAKDVDVIMAFFQKLPHENK